jgi:NAD(P)-dependent dehydrogenase (short-subunit alcohol dehydrogenase family)
VVTLKMPDIVVITGTASGLGQSITSMCAASGSDVIGVDLKEVRQDIRGGSYKHVNASVDDPGTWQRIAREVQALPDSYSIGLVCVAAVLMQGTAEELSPEEWHRVLGVNVVGPALGLGTLAPVMAGRGGGPVVMVGSVNATFGEESLLAYNASKGALRQLVRTAALDYGKHQVRVNMVSPGPMETEMFLKHLRMADDPAEFRSSRERRQPLGRILKPEEVAGGIAFLISDYATGITGADLVIDGGLTAGFEYRNIAMHTAGV